MQHNAQAFAKLKSASEDLVEHFTDRRLRIKRLLRKHRTLIATDGGGLDAMAERLFEQARVIYQRWPEIEGAQW